MVKRIYLIRHGKIDTGHVKRYLGITDLPLNQEGIFQAKKLERYFRYISIDRIVSSPLTRCIQTAKIICKEKNQDYEVVKGFREINMGLWENQSIDDMKKNHPEVYHERGNHLLSFKPPKGESFGQLAERVLPTFDRVIKDYTGTVMIVGHAGVNRTILRKIERISIQDFFHIQQPYACGYELELNDNEKWEVERLF